MMQTQHPQRQLPPPLRLPPLPSVGLPPFNSLNRTGSLIDHRKRQRPDSMDRPPSRGNPRPTLPSLRSTVGDYLPANSSSSSARRMSVSGGRPSSMAFPSSSGRPSIDSFPQRPPQPPLQPMGRRTSFSGGAPPPAAPPILIPSGRRSYRAPSPQPTSDGMMFPSSQHSQVPVAATRTTVTVACTNCRSAHLACSEDRPCRRCCQTGRAATCVDVEPRKRGRPRASEAGSGGGSAEADSRNRPMPPSQDPITPIIILSTSLRCARVTNAVTHLLGHTMLEQPLSSFIHPEDKSDYARFSLKLLDFPNVISRPVPVSQNRLHSTNFTELLAPLVNASTHAQVFRVRTSKGTYENVKFESYLGGGFGASPSNRESLKLTYVVAKLTQLGGSTGSYGSAGASSNGSSGDSSTQGSPMAKMSGYGGQRARADSYGYGSLPMRAPSPSAPMRAPSPSRGGFAAGRPPSRSGFSYR